MPNPKKFWKRELQGFDPWAVDKRIYRFHPEVADRVISWWESNLVLSKSLKPFLLEDWQKQVIGHFFGWKKRKTGYRRFRTLWLYVPRKNGKTEMGAGLAIIALVADREPGAEVYSAAADTDQARIVYEAASTMVQENDTLKDVVQIYKGYKSMKYIETASYWKVLSAKPRTKHGYNPHSYIVDEVHAHPKADLMEALETGTSARKQPMGIYLTTADHDRASVCNTYLDYAKLVRDENIDPTWLPVIYELPQDADWHDEKNWFAVNPNLEVCKNLDYMRQQHGKAKRMSEHRDTFKRLDLNIQTKSKDKWLSVNDWDEAEVPESEIKLLEGEECLLSVDLSSNRDLTACGAYFPEHEFFMVHFWVPEEAVENRMEYRMWAKNDWLTQIPGRTINTEFVRAHIQDWADLYDVQMVGFDPWNAAQFAYTIGEEDEIPVMEIRQGYATMNEPAKLVEKMLLEHRIKHVRNPVMRWNVDNVERQMGPHDNIKPVKPKTTEYKKVDGVITLVMCIALSMGPQDEEEEDPMGNRVAQGKEPLLTL